MKYMSKQCRGGDAMGIRSIKEAVLLEGWRFGGKGKGEGNHMEKRCFRENGMGMGGERGGHAPLGSLSAWSRTDQEF